MGRGKRGPLKKEFPLHLNMEGRREQEKTEAVAFMPWKVKARPVGGLEGESVAAPAPASCGWSSFTSSVEGKTGEMRVEKISVQRRQQRGDSGRGITVLGEGRGGGSWLPSQPFPSSVS